MSPLAPDFPAPDSAFGPGLADPVLDSQRCFRALLDAMSRPGTVRVAGEDLRPPAPLAPATAAVLLTLVDADVPLWLDAAMAPAWPWLRFHCGAVPATSIGVARFVCAMGGDGAMPDLAALDAGSDLAPEDGATLVLQLASLGTGAVWRLRGPGIEDEAVLRAGGLPRDLAARWAANHALYPRGVDLVLCAGDVLCALPRSVRIEADAAAPRDGEG